MISSVRGVKCRIDLYRDLDEGGSRCRCHRGMLNLQFTESIYCDIERLDKTFMSASTIPIAAIITLHAQVVLSVTCMRIS